MKKNVVLIVILLMSLWLYCDVTVAEIKGHSFRKFINNFVEEELVLKYQEDTERFYLLLKQGKVTIEITIDEEYRDKLYEIIKDFEKMKRRAVAWEETYDKEIGRLPVAESRFHKGSSWYNSKVNTEVNFFSQNLEWHQLILFFSEMHAAENKNVHNNQFSLYFWDDDVRNLKKVFSKRAFKNYKKKVEQGKQ